MTKDRAQKRAEEVEGELDAWERGRFLLPRIAPFLYPLSGSFRKQMHRTWRFQWNHGDQMSVIMQVFIGLLANGLLYGIVVWLVVRVILEMVE
jgi:hypothetical protein